MTFVRHIGGHTPESLRRAGLAGSAKASAMKRNTVPPTALAIRPGFESFGPVRGCQWIEGEPSEQDACKCGAPALPERPYCRKHCEVAYVRGAAGDGA